MNSGARHFQAGGIAQVDAQKQEEAWQAIGAKRRHSDGNENQEEPASCAVPSAHGKLFHDWILKCLRSSQGIGKGGLSTPIIISRGNKNHS